MTDDVPASHAGLGASDSQTLCVIRLPRQEDAPAYRRSLSADSLLRVEDFGNDVAGVVPVEGPGATKEYFRVEWLCAADTDLRDPETWAALRKVPPTPQSRTGVSINLAADPYAVIGHDEAVDKAIYALGLEALSATDGRDLERILQDQAAGVVRAVPPRGLALCDDQPGADSSTHVRSLATCHPAHPGSPHDPRTA